MTTQNSQQTSTKTETFVDTGSYIFNGLVSGSIFGGVSGNKITAIAESLVLEKLSMALRSSRIFLIATLMEYCLYFDTEALVNKSLSQSWD